MRSELNRKEQEVRTITEVLLKAIIQIIKDATDKADAIQKIERLLNDN